jgi:hypothetical protein
MKTDGGRVRWVCSSSHEPGDGGVNAGEDESVIDGVSR